MSGGWRPESLDDLREVARSILIETEGCRCPDEPHQNALHDLAFDLLALESASDGLANACRHGSASGVDTAPIGPGKVWACDHCGLRWKDER